jgi:hypothetical protein
MSHLYRFENYIAEKVTPGGEYGRDESRKQN